MAEASFLDAQKTHLLRKNTLLTRLIEKMTEASFLDTQKTHF